MRHNAPVLDYDLTEQERTARYFAEQVAIKFGTLTPTAVKTLQAAILAAMKWQEKHGN